MSPAVSPVNNQQEMTAIPFRILVVDDEPLMRWSLEKSLKKAGYATASVASAELAQEKLRAATYDLVITDMRLPGEDGFAVAASAQECAHHPTVILITAFGDPDSRKRAREMGIRYFVDKPFDLSEMVNLVKGISGHRHGENR
ncbi:MAG: response regulator [Fidelibacterota bacterium]